MKDTLIFIHHSSSSLVAGAAEAEVVEAAVGRGVAAGGDAIVAAKVFGAQPRATFDHALCAARRPRRIVGRARRIVIVRVPIGAPLPDVADHVGQTVTVRRETADGCAAAITVFACVAFGEMALPPVGDGSAAGAQFIAPRVGLPLEAAARRRFPFGFSGQALARPARVGGSVGPRNLTDRLVGRGL